MAPEKSELIAMAKTVAQGHSLPPDLVCAVVEQESAWNPWAIRYEPGFFTRYIQPQINDGKLVNVTESRARAFSFGLMQIMGQVARERGFTGKYLSELCDPMTNIMYGCKHLRNRIQLANGEIEKGLLLWNGGGRPAYPSEVLARMDKYK